MSADRPVGVIGHLRNPSAAQAVALGVEAEAAGAAWLGLADAFWWRDVWLLLAEVARVTSWLEIGPAMTNPYLRHPFHTLSAVATLQELAGDRVFLGLAAGGSEAAAAAGVDRRDAPERLAALAELFERVSSGEVADERSGLRLETPPRPAPMMIAGGKNRMIDVAGAWGDRVLVWATPRSDLPRVTGRIRAAARARGRSPQLVWAPLVEPSGGEPGEHVRRTAIYSILNAAGSTQRRWGLEPELVARIRAELVAARHDQAVGLLPRAALDDLVLTGDAAEPGQAGQLAGELGFTAVAVPAFELGGLRTQVAWGHAVLAASESVRPG